MFTNLTVEENIKLVLEMTTLSKKDQKDKLELLNDLNLNETTLKKVIYAGYNLLNLITFFKCFSR